MPFRKVPISEMWHDTSSVLPPLDNERDAVDPDLSSRSRDGLSEEILLSAQRRNELERTLTRSLWLI